jgi:hypothetical protein
VTCHLASDSPHIVIVYQLPPTKGKGRPLRVDDVNVSFKNAMQQWADEAAAPTKLALILDHKVADHHHCIVMPQILTFFRLLQYSEATLRRRGGKQSRPVLKGRDAKALDRLLELAHDSQISLHVHFAVVTEQQSVYASTEQGRRGLVVKEAVRSG